MPSFEVEASEIARMMRMRTVANMIPAMVEDKFGPMGAVSLLFVRLFSLYMISAESYGFRSSAPSQDTGKTHWLVRFAAVSCIAHRIVRDSRPAP